MPLLALLHVMVPTSLWQVNIGSLAQDDGT